MTSIRNEEALESAFLQYFAGDDWAARGFQPLSSIVKQIGGPDGRAHSYFSHLPAPTEQEIGRLLEQMVEHDLLVRGPSTPTTGEPSYFASDHGIYEASFGTEALVVEETSDDEPIRYDPSTWTGLPKAGTLSVAGSERLKAALKLVDAAVDQSQATNEERAQARAYLIALQALADAPEPPAELLWKIITLAAALAGIGSLFVGLLDLYK